jgi:hypothetical protein
MQINQELLFDTSVLEDVRASFASVKRAAASISVSLPSRSIGKSRVLAAAIEAARDEGVSVIGPDGTRFRIWEDEIQTAVMGDDGEILGFVHGAPIAGQPPVTIEDTATIHRRAARRRQRLARRITRQHRSGRR